MRSRFHLQVPARPSVPGVFFYLWQHIFFPLGNRFFIPLKRSPLWTLATPAHPVKNVPDCTRMTSNAEQLPYDLSNAVKRPIVSKIPVCRSATFQCLL